MQVCKDTMEYFYDIILSVIPWKQAKTLHMKFYRNCKPKASRNLEFTVWHAIVFHCDLMLQHFESNYAKNEQLLVFLKSSVHISKKICIQQHKRFARLVTLYLNTRILQASCRFRRGNFYFHRYECMYTHSRARTRIQTHARAHFMCVN